MIIYRKTSDCICKDHRNEIEAPDPVVKDIITDLINYKTTERFYKKKTLVQNHIYRQTIFF